MNIARLYVHRKNKLAVLILSAYLLFLFIALFLYGATSFGVGASFVYGYCLLPFFWVLWIGQIICYEKKSSFKGILFAFALLNLANLILLKTSSLLDEHFYNAKGTDLFMLIVNFPVMFPFGLFSTYFLNEVTGVFNHFSGYIRMWVEIFFSSIFQGLVIILINITVRRLFLENRTEEFRKGDEG